MAYAYFEVEITNELNGMEMVFDYAVDLYDYTDEEVKEYQERAANGELDAELASEILEWISVTPRLTRVEDD